MNTLRVNDSAYLQFNDSWAIQHPEIATQRLFEWEQLHPRESWTHSIDNSRPGFTTYHVKPRHTQ